MAQAYRDENSVPTLIASSNVDGSTPVRLYADPTTHRLLVDLPTSGGTVTSVSVVSANGLAGTVATATTTPAITLSTTVNAPALAGNGTAISAATTTGSGSTVVLNGSPTLITPSIAAITVSGGIMTVPSGSTDTLVARNTTDTLTNKTLVAPALGTPASGTVTNLTGTASININGTVGATTPTTGSFTTVRTYNAIELGNASDTTVSRSSAGVMAVEGVVIPSISSTNTLTNKRITRRTGTTASSATPTINTDSVDEYYITAQTVAITSFTTNLSGTPTLGQTLFISVIGTAARAITWGASFANGPVALPTTTVTTTQLSVLLKWDGSIWRCYATGSTV